MNKYIETQEELISTAQSMLTDKERVDAVVFRNNEFIIFINTHASSWPQVTQYVNPGARGYDQLKEVIFGH